MSPRASVTSQVVPQPFLLGSNSPRPGMSRTNTDKLANTTTSNLAISDTTTTAADSSASADAPASNSTTPTQATATPTDSPIGIGISGLVKRGSQRGRRTSTDPDSMAPVYRLYPRQSSSGRRELRAMERPEGGDRPHTAASNSSRSRSKGRLSSVDNVRILSDDNVAVAHDQQQVSHSAQNANRYSVHRHGYTQSESQIGVAESLRAPPGTANGNGPEFSDMDDAANGEPGLAIDGTQGTLPIPNRNSNTRRTNGQQPHARSSPPPNTRDYRNSDATQRSLPPSPQDAEDIYGPGARSSAGSIFSQETSATSIHTLPPLQTKPVEYADLQTLEPVIEDDPSSWDLVGPPPPDQEIGLYALEQRADQLFSAEHLRIIFDDPKLLLRFTGFLNTHRPQSIPILIYYLDALKAIRAIGYANAIAEALEPIKGQQFTQDLARPTINSALEEKANRAFDVLVQEDLPAYVAYTWIQVVSLSIQRRITGTLAPHLREASEGLAEVFCLTDPSRTDSPIVFASEEFTRTTQYGMNYLIGRNCRFLQGPRTNPNSVRRLAIATAEGKELTEVFVNYRRDGSPFLNLLMIAPLMDSRGAIRYYIGAQVDVSGLLKDCAEMEGLQKLIDREREYEARAAAGNEDDDPDQKDEFNELCEMFNGAELDTVRRFGGRMHKEYVDDSDQESVLGQSRPRLLLKDPSQELLESSARGRNGDVPEEEGDTPRAKRPVSESTSSTIREKINGKLEGIYSHYLLVRPAPSLRILFTSPSLRVPGILQSPFLHRIGGSSRVRADLRAALAEGRGVTAKIRWLSRPDEDGEGEGRPRWIHCTPLLGHSGAVGVWMIVLVDDERAGSIASTRRFRQAPPISNVIGGKEWDPAAVAANSGRRHVSHYDKENERRGGNSNGTSGTTTGNGSTSQLGFYPSSQTRSASRQQVNGTHGASSGDTALPQATTTASHHPALSSGASEFSFNLK